MTKNSGNNKKGKFAKQQKDYHKNYKANIAF